MPVGPVAGNISADRSVSTVAVEPIETIGEQIDTELAAEEASQLLPVEQPIPILPEQTDDNSGLAARVAEVTAEPEQVETSEPEQPPVAEPIPLLAESEPPVETPRCGAGSGT